MEWTKPEYRIVQDEHGRGGGSASGGCVMQTTISCGRPYCTYGCQGFCLRPGEHVVTRGAYARGCICPAGANKDCENLACPRKDPMGIMSEKRQV